MAHPHINNPVIRELDEIAAELEKTGNADLATLVDEVGAELLTSSRRTVSAKKSTKKDEKADKSKARAKKNKKPAKKEAEANFGSRRARIASAMRKIARAQVAELEDIAAELIKEGEKKAALEVLKIAEDLDSDYEYSATGKHSKPEGKGDASKRFDRETANKPDAKMDAEDKENLELPFGEKGEGYPKQSAFDRQLDNLIRLAMDEAEDMGTGTDMAASDVTAGDEADEDMDMPEDSNEDDGDMDLGGLDEESDEESDEDEGESDEESDAGEEEPDDDADDMDLGGLDLGDGEDELAAMMDSMEGAEPTDMEAADRMYGAEEGDEGDEEPSMPSAPEPAESPLGDEEEGDEEEEDDMGLGESDEDMGAGLEAPASEPMVTAMKFSSADKAKMASLVKALVAKGEKGLAARVAKLAR